MMLWSLLILSFLGMLAKLLYFITIHSMNTVIHSFWIDGETRG